MELHHKYIDYIKNHYGKYSQFDITSIAKEYESKIFVSNKLDVQLNESKDFDMNIRIDHIRDESQCYDYIKENNIKPFSDDWYEIIFNEEQPYEVFDGSTFQIMNFNFEDMNLKCIPVFKFKKKDSVNVNIDKPYNNRIHEYDAHIGIPHDFYQYEVFLDASARVRWGEHIVGDEFGENGIVEHTGFNINLLNPISGEWLPISLYFNIKEFQNEYSNYDLNTKILDFPSIKLHLENIKKYGKK